MNKVFIVFSSVVALLSTPTVAQDSWTGQDKVDHAVVSAMFGGIAGASMDNKYAAFGVAMLPGIAKELYDMTGRGTPSWKDLAADAAGAAIGVYIGNCWLRKNSLVCHFEFQ